MVSGVEQARLVQLGKRGRERVGRVMIEQGIIPHASNLTTVTAMANTLGKKAQFMQKKCCIWPKPENGDVFYLFHLLLQIIILVTFNDICT